MLADNSSAKNLEEDMMKTEEIVFREYTKDIFPYFNGNGAVLHTISAVCKNPKTAEIEHYFGQDECLNEFVTFENSSLDDANLLLRNKDERMKNKDYSFIIYSNDSSKLIIKELKSDKNEKKFKLLWKKSFGNKKNASYVWGWLNNVMFSSFPGSDGQHSIVKTVYSTQKLILRVHFPEMYPLDGNPSIFMIDKGNKETEIAKAVKTNLFNEIMPFDLRNRPIEKSYKAIINNPIQGNTYKVVWDIGFESMSKYLAWLESRI
jgi:hypothetical protein